MLRLRTARTLCEELPKSSLLSMWPSREGHVARDCVARKTVTGETLFTESAEISLATAEQENGVAKNAKEPYIFMVEQEDFDNQECAVGGEHSLVLDSGSEIHV